MAKPQPYNEKSECRKCGGKIVFTIYHRDGGRDCPYGCIGQASKPHMIRRCERCSYRWCEMPLDEVDSNG